MMRLGKLKWVIIIIGGVVVMMTNSLIWKSIGLAMVFGGTFLK